MSEIEEILEFRKGLYAFLYRMYLEEPPRKLVEDLVSNKFPFLDLESLNEEISEGLEILKSYGKGKNVDEIYEDLVDEYTLLFVGPYRLPVPPYESIWVDGKMAGESLLRLKEDYRRAGISKSRSYPEPEDHIAFELKFMHHLCEEELATEDDEELLKYLQMQNDFLSDHLMNWAPDFCDAMVEYESSDFYKCIAKITKGFLNMDAKVVKELIEE
ncbi:MAG: molecular chaperone TorD family protein [Halobacteriota archaeon]|nr:molecular chaperone TorD family protein [Halobacteriota archaeon]